MINGSFITNAAREGLHEDRIWNLWLFKLVAEKILAWLEILASSKFKFHILELLPEKDKGLRNELHNRFFDSLMISSKETAFVPSKSLQLKKATELIVDKTGLSELSFIANSMIEFISLQVNSNFKNDSFVNPKLQRTSKLSLFGTQTFGDDTLKTFFYSPIFKNAHQLEDNFSLIEYLYNKTTSEEKGEFFEKLKHIPFIYAKGKQLKSPQEICFPIESSFDKKVAVIHTKVYFKIKAIELGTCIIIKTAPCFKLQNNWLKWLAWKCKLVRP